jgi:RecJ-like exonuclease
LLVAALLAASPRVEAHHSFTGAYNVDKTIVIKGKIVQIAIRSPHSFFYVESQDEKGATQQWAVEGASAGQFARQGIDARSFRVGDVVEVTANPSRTTDSTRVRLIKIVRPSDGKSWGTGDEETFN